MDFEQSTVNAIYTYMTHVARTDKDFAYYGEIIRMAGIGHLGEGAIEGALGDVLFAVNHYDWEQDANRPMLSAIAISSQTGAPGGGLYRLARDIGKLTSHKELDELTFWVNEEKLLRRYWREHSQTVFRGASLSYEAVYDAIIEFGRQYPDTSAYQGWFDQPSYKYALEFSGKFYPPKHILSIASNTDVSEYSGGSQTNRVFEQLGFIITDKSSEPPVPSVATHRTYLLTWNPSKSRWDNFPEDWNAFHIGARPRLRWSCGNTQGIVPGDRVFLMRLGRQELATGIVASGIVSEASFEAEHWNKDSGSPTARFVYFEPDVLLNPDTDDLLEPRVVSDEFDWRPQRSGISIPPDIAAKLEPVWQQHIQQGEPEAKPPKQDAADTYLEGARTLIYSYRYERDPRARDACIQYHGTRCAICAFDFGEVFGEIGEGFIHVHHLTPISDRNTIYEVDPIEDLRPVCPNCHAMLHRKSPPYSIDELKAIRSRHI